MRRQGKTTGPDDKWMEMPEVSDGTSRHEGMRQEKKVVEEADDETRAVEYDRTTSEFREFEMKKHTQGRQHRAMTIPGNPTKFQIEENEVPHILYRVKCSHCVRGSATNCQGEGEGREGERGWIRS